MELNFVKGFTLEDGTIVLEGEVITVVNVQGVVYCGRLKKPAKKEFQLTIDGELESKVFNAKSVGEIFKGKVADEE